MKKAGFALLIFLAFLLETRISIFSVSPNLTAAVVYCFGLRNGESKGLLFGAFIGLVGDGLSGGFIGPDLFSKGIEGFLSSFMSGSFFRWTPVTGMVGITFLTALSGIMEFLARTTFESMPSSFSHAVMIIIISALLNAVFGAFIRPKND